jgi:hypothetical protein
MRMRIQKAKTRHSVEDDEGMIGRGKRRAVSGLSSCHPDAALYIHQLIEERSPEKKLLQTFQFTDSSQPCERIFCRELDGEYQARPGLQESIQSYSSLAILSS